MAHSGCASPAELPVNPSKYRVIELREAPTIDFLPTMGWGDVSLRWIDNKRILFGAYDKDLRKQIQRDGRTIEIGVQTLQTWNIDAGDVLRYWPEKQNALNGIVEEVGHFCVSDDYLRFVVLREKSVSRAGQVGKEIEADLVPRVDLSGNKVFALENRFTCRLYWPGDYPRPNRGVVTPLKDEHGTFEDNKAPAVARAGEIPRRWLHKPDGSSIELPVHDEHVSVSGYSQHLGIYLLVRRDSVISRGMPNKLYSLFPDTGRLNSLEIPGSQHWTYLANPRPVRTGLVASVHANNVRANWDPADSGLYLFYGPPVERFFSRRAGEPADGKTERGTIQVERLSRGSVRDLDVSPDGCKVATLLDPWHREGRRAYLHVVDICTKGR